MKHLLFVYEDQDTSDTLYAALTDLAVTITARSIYESLAPTHGYTGALYYPKPYDVKKVYLLANMVEKSSCWLIATIHRDHDHAKFQDRGFLGVCFFTMWLYHLTHWNSVF